MSNRSELLAVMRMARTDVEAVVATLAGRLGDDAGIGNDWQVRDSLMHVALWERVAAHTITGLPLPDGDDLWTREPWDMDAFNDGMRERWRSKADEAVLAKFAEAHRELVAAVEAAGEESCAPGGEAWTAISEDGAGHYSSHFPVANRIVERWESQAFP